MGDTRVVRDNVEELATALQRADQLRARALQDTHYPARRLFGWPLPRNTWSNVQPH
jgi:hypothetical protein